MSVSHLHRPGRRVGARGSIGPRDGAGLAGLLFALTASVAVWAVAIVVLVHVLT